MPPKQSTAGASRGRPPGSKNKAAPSAAASKKPSAAAKGKQRAQPSESPERRHRDDSEELIEVDQDMDDDGDDEEPEKTIPPELLTRILHEFFEKDGTRITKDANNALAKYMDIFVKEAIARAAAERDGGFLEVEDLEKVAPQLLFDL
ncbi:CENP-S associating centromere protein X-domain-containing protein [Diaporthe sp. PMI_573]|nr:CENP-S associating centromere protein X-domain-containing protein [Diaporthaceae sp. PMI_573]